MVTAWKAVTRAHKSDLSLLEAYYGSLMRAGEHDRVEKELAAALRSDWRGPLVRLFGLVESSDTTRQLKRAEGWLKNHGDDPDLLLTSARLCLRNELWGKARSYLETVLSLRPTPEAYQEYGNLLNQMGEADAAASAYRDGLGLVVPSVVETLDKFRRVLFRASRVRALNKCVVVSGTSSNAYRRKRPLPLGNLCQ